MMKRSKVVWRREARAILSKAVVLTWVLIVASGSPAGGGTIIVQDDFDSYPVGPLDGQGNWTGTCASVVTQQAGIAPPESSPNFVYLSQACEAIWEITALASIGGLSVEFYAEFQRGGNTSDPHIYISGDGQAWTEVTSEFGITYGCDMPAMLYYSADLTSYLTQAGVGDTVFIKWANENPELPNCYVIGFDSVTATVTMAQGSWETVAAMNTGRQRHGAALGSDGMIYAVGGYGPVWPGGDRLSSVERYDPTRDSWEYVASMSVARVDLGVTADDCGRIYAVGGEDDGGTILRLVERYDPASPAAGWTILEQMPTARVGLETAFSGGKLYAIGGVLPGGSWDTTGVVEVYDPCADTWTNAPSLNDERAYFGVGVDNGGKIYVFAGATDGGTHISSVEHFDPSITDPNDPAYGWQIVDSMADIHVGASATDTTSGLIYLLGGWGPGHLCDVLVYDPQTAQWGTYKPMPRCINNFAAVFDPCGRLYAIGGEHFDTQAQVDRILVDGSDSDGDGIPDLCDVCPNLPSPAGVGADYRPLGDFDGDCDVDLDDFGIFSANYTGAR